MHGHSERGRLLEKLLRELVRAELHAVEHAEEAAGRFAGAPPAHALSEVSEHVHAMRPRLTFALDGHRLVAGRGGLGTTLERLRYLVDDRPERSYPAALLDLRHGVDIVRVLREVARVESLFALIRWCDDWLGVRRPLIARVEAQLGWFAREA